MLVVKDLHKRFGRLEVLKGINFDLNHGEVVAIIGASGSGKTTLLRCLNFLERPDRGKIVLNNEVLFESDSDWDFRNLMNAEQMKKVKDKASRVITGKEKLARISEKEIRDKRLHFGMVFQSFNLFPQFTVLKNVMLAPKLLAKERRDKEALAELEEYAWHLLKRTGLEDKAYSYPCELSGGQQQRVAIARALALSPEILCFDEPTSALDPELTGEVLKVIRDLRYADSTMIVVTHEMDFARNVADRIIFMSNGVIEEAGTPSEVLDNPKSAAAKAFLSVDHSIKL